LEAFKMGVATGAGLTVEAVANLCGVVPGTYYNRTAKHPGPFDLGRSFGQILRERAIAAEVTKAKVSEKAEDKIISRLDRALSLGDRAIDKLEAMGDTATLKDLLLAHKILTEFYADFAASKAPKRVQVEGGVAHEHRIVLDSTVDGLTAFAAHIQRLKLPAADAIEAEVVS
jgi:hypothetical protein